MISIVTPWLGHQELVPAYERSVIGAEVIIVDNASEPDTAAALDAMVARLGNGSKVIHEPENRYFTRANNLGYQLTTGEIVVFINNDIEAPPQWLGPVERDVVDGTLFGPSVLDFDVDGTAYPYVEGWCVAATREVWGRLRCGVIPGRSVRLGDELLEMDGPWNEIDYPRFYGDDLDLSFRARLAGCSLARAAWSIKHLGNSTTKTLPGAYDHANANREVFRESVRRWRESQAT